MRIGLDISPALAEGGGLRRYVELLLGGLSRVASDEEFFLYSAFWSRFPGQALSLKLPQDKRFKLALRRFPQRLLLPAEQFLGLRIQERWLKPLNLDVFHGLGNILPPVRRLRTVVTMHHVGGPPDIPSWWGQFYFTTQVRRSVCSADRVIAISDSTRKDIIQEYGVPPERVVRVYHGGPDPFFNPDAAPEPLEPLGVRKPYVLFVSALHKRKNLEVLVEAFSRVKSKWGGRSLQLVLVGPKSAYFPELERFYTERGLSSDIRVLESVSPTALRSLYQCAEVFAYPSKLEGFGFPPMEAMACGTPVVAARATALPEVVADAGILVDPDSAGEFSLAILWILSDPSLRAELREKGLARVRDFSWEETARQTLAVYRQAVRSGTAP
ncbi:MAG: glycosyltransferase family 4 protein [Elusimicrobia bacterium]|nr:glycosyltransferase family 4 protein [Elusimicrobiota bacterium]